MDIPLTTAVQTLREELLEAAKQGEGAEITFEVGPIEMEFEVEFRKDVRAKTGFAAWIATAEAEAGVERGRTQRVAFTLTPRTRDGKDVSIKGGRQIETDPEAFSGHLGR
ncbi:MULTISPECIES: trypco2 family protein [unclassified Nocardiopsis]|uniref:trypco2 family protein n=1 Tax=Nocardiopsis TaxID=2013 RepID=UPI00387A907C